MATTSKPKPKPSHQARPSRRAQAKSNGAQAKSNGAHGAVRRFRMFIGGKFANASSGKTFDVFDPATESVIATCPAGGAADVDRAAKAAKRAFYDVWRGHDGAGQGARAAAACGACAGAAGGAGGTGDAELGETDRRIRVRRGRRGDLLSSITAGWPRRSTATCCRCPRSRWRSRCASRWESRGRSSRGTIRCSWRRGSSGRRSLPAAPWCSSPPSRRRCRYWRWRRISRGWAFRRG